MDVKGKPKGENHRESIDAETDKRTGANNSEKPRARGPTNQPPILSHRRLTRDTLWQSYIDNQKTEKAYDEYFCKTKNEPFERR